MSQNNIKQVNVSNDNVENNHVTINSIKASFRVWISVYDLEAELLTVKITGLQSLE